MTTQVFYHRSPKQNLSYIKEQFEERRDYKINQLQDFDRGKKKTKFFYMDMENPPKYCVEKMQSIF